MKSILLGCFGLLLLSFQIGCCAVGPVGGCSTGSCGIGGGCGPGLFNGALRDRLAGGHCTTGCGEVYWDEQINEPPVCDPCGYGGEFVGGQSCGSCPGSLSRFRQLFGFTYTPSDCDTCSMGPSPVSPCSDGSCSSGGCSTCGSDSYSGSTTGYSSQSYSSNPGPSHSMSAPRAPSNSNAAPQGSRPTPATRKPGPVPDLEPTGKLPPAPTVGSNNRNLRSSSPRPVVVGSGVSVRQASHR